MRRCVMSVVLVRFSGDVCFPCVCVCLISVRWQERDGRATPAVATTATAATAVRKTRRRRGGEGGGGWASVVFEGSRWYPIFFCFFFCGDAWAELSSSDAPPVTAVGIQRSACSSRSTVPDTGFCK